MQTLPRPFDGAAGQWPTVLGELREAGPVHLIVLPSGQETWLVTRYAEVLAGLTDPRLANVPGTGLPEDHGLSDDIMHGVTDGLLVMMHGPEHTRIRRLVSRAFTARRVEELRPRIEQLTGELLDGLAGGTFLAGKMPYGRGEFDLIEDLAYPLSMRVLGELLGLPGEDMAAFRGWVLAYINSVGAQVYPAPEITEFVGYLRRLIASKRANPDGALLAALTEVQDAGDGTLSGTELTSCVCLLIAAGFETSVNGIGNSVYHLLTQPGEAELLRAQPGAVAAVAERCLHLYPPVVSSFVRFAAEPLELGGVAIPAGSLVLFSLLSANHDSAGFAGDGAPPPEHPPAGPHVSFGHGAHYCLGAALARAEIQTVVSALVRRFPGLRLAVPAADLTWVGGGIFTRALAHLPVSAGPEAAAAASMKGQDSRA